MLDGGDLLTDWAKFSAAVDQLTLCGAVGVHTAPSSCSRHSLAIWLPGSRAVMCPDGSLNRCVECRCTEAQEAWQCAVPPPRHLPSWCTL